MATVKTKAKFYKAAIKKLGLSQAKAAAFLQISPRQSRRLAGGHATLGRGEEMLLQVMLHTGLTVKAVNDICDPKPAPKASKKKAAAEAAAV